MAYQQPTQMIRDRLAFGRKIPTGGLVSERAWEDFEREEITRRFPSGYSIQRVEGVWADERTGRPIREPTIVLDVARPDSFDAERSIREIAAAYKARFEQDAVMRSTTAVDVSFL